MDVKPLLKAFFALKISSGEGPGGVENPSRGVNRCCASGRGAGGFLGDARDPFAPGQFGLDIRQRDAARRAHDQQMKQHIRRLGGQPVAVALDGLDHGLDRLFAEFLGAFLGALGQQFCRPRGFGVGPLARLDGGGEPLQCANVSLTGMPAAAIWALA